MSEKTLKELLEFPFVVTAFTSGKKEIYAAVQYPREYERLGDSLGEWVKKAMYEKWEREFEKPLCMNRYYVVVVNSEGLTAVFDPIEGENIEAFIADLATNRFDYNSEAMKDMVGDFEKCTGLMFDNCRSNRNIRGTDRGLRVKNCKENCPGVLTPEQWLDAQRGKCIVIIDSERGEVWRNDPYSKTRNERGIL